MALGRRQDLWDHTACLMSFVAARMPFAAEKLDPRTLNPYRRQTLKRTPGMVERDNKAGWKLLETAARQIARDH